MDHFWHYCERAVFQLPGESCIWQTCGIMKCRNILRNEYDYIQNLTQVGLAVDDVKELQMQANYHRVKLMVSIQIQSPTQALPLE